MGVGVGVTSVIRSSGVAVFGIVVGGGGFVGRAVGWLVGAMAVGGIAVGVVPQATSQSARLKPIQ